MLYDLICLKSRFNSTSHWKMNKVIYHRIIHGGRDLWRSPGLKGNQFLSYFPGISDPCLKFHQRWRNSQSFLDPFPIYGYLHWRSFFFKYLTGVCVVLTYIHCFFLQYGLHLGSTSPLQTCLATGFSLPWEPWWRHWLPCLILSLGSGSLQSCTLSHILGQAY